jgi:copper oxidase (laccase) domain-containing protein
VEVKQAFCNICPKLSLFFIKSSTDKFQADLAGIATYLLKKLGVVSIAHLKECTFTQKNKYYSYRRDYKTGRMASVICLNK